MRSFAALCSAGSPFAQAVVTAWQFAPEDPKRLADQIVDSMVLAKPNDPDVYLERYAYRMQYELPNAAEDLQSALGLGPNRLEVLLAAADDSRREAARVEGSDGWRAARKLCARELYDRACSCYETAKRIAPVDERVYAGLGETQQARGQVTEAIQTLQQGLQNANPHSLRLNDLLANAFLARGQLREADLREADLREADKLAQSLQKAVGQLDPRVPPQFRATLSNEAELIRAKVHHAKGELPEAVALLTSVSRGQRDTPFGLRQCVPAWMLLGNTYAGLRQWELAAGAYEQAAALKPPTTEPRMRAGVAWANAGRLDSAATQFGLAVARDGSAAAYRALGMVLGAEGRPKEAESALRKAKELAPDDVRILSSLFDFYVRNKNPDPAREALQEFAKNEKLTPTQRALVMAQGYETLGDRQQAKLKYQEAVGLAPDDEAVHVACAQFLSRGGNEGDSLKAEELLRAFLKRVPQAGNARRTLAALLVDRGGEKEWQEAQGLLGQSGGDGPGSAALDRRMQALTLFRRCGSENLARAKRILESLVPDSKERTPFDRLLLAQIYETEGKLSDARKEYLALVNVASPATSHLAGYIDLLLRHDQADEAGKWTDRLGQAAPDELQTVQLRVRWLHAKGRASEIRPLVTAFAGRVEKQAAKDRQLESQLCLNVGNLYSSVEQHQAAEEWYRRLAGLAPESYGPLVMSLARQNRFSEAIDLCTQAAKSDDSPRPALTLASALVTGQPTPEHCQLAEPLLARALERHKEDPALLSALGGVRIREQRVAEAIDLYQRLLRLRPRDVVAMNNLATLLGEQPDKRSQALTYIDTAIQIAGPQPFLMDTKGMILLYDGKLDEAVKLLQAAASVPNPDPRYRFHLAVAHQRLGEAAKAREALKAARNDKLESQVLTEADRKMLAELDRKLGE